MGSGAAAQAERACPPDPASKLVPVPTPDTAYFWEQACRGQLVLQRCRRCQAFQFYPRAVCHRCLGEELEWVPSAGTGHVYSFSVVHRPPNPAYAPDVPYVVAIVELDEGVRMMANVVDCEPDRVYIGMRVAVTFERRGSVLLPQFRPDPQAERLDARAARQGGQAAAGQEAAGQEAGARG